MKARLYGYTDATFQIPTGIDERFRITMVPLPTGTIRIGAKPWARVSFRGKEMGETPVILEEVPVGRETVTLSYDPLGAERRISIEVKEGMNTVNVDMRE